MMISIIDIGSNSVRLAIFADGRIILRKKITSRLGDGLSVLGEIPDYVFQRNLNAVKDLVDLSINNGVSIDKIFPFATATIRQAKNGDKFVEKVFCDFGVKVNVFSEADECKAGVLGALQYNDGTVLDIGGASSELIVQKDHKIVYAKSVDTGAVKLTDAFKEDTALLEDFINKKIDEYKLNHIDSLIAIGGTATCFGHIVTGGEYNREKNHGTKVAITDLYAHLLQISKMTPEKRSQTYNINIKRAETIYSGGLLLYNILKKFNLDGYTVSENDNIEGYYNMITGALL